MQLMSYMEISTSGEPDRLTGLSLDASLSEKISSSDDKAMVSEILSFSIEIFRAEEKLNGNHTIKTGISRHHAPFVVIKPVDENSTRLYRYAKASKLGQVKWVRVSLCADSSPNNTDTLPVVSVTLTQPFILSIESYGDPSFLGRVYESPSSSEFWTRRDDNYGRPLFCEDSWFGPIDRIEFSYKSLTWSYPKDGQKVDLKDV